jgi:hypothetical protein
MSDSIRYCQDNKGLELNAYVFMLNPVHLIVTLPNMAGFLRDFKRFIAAKFKANLETTEPSVLKLFIDTQGSYRFWMETNAPKKRGCISEASYTELGCYHPNGIYHFAPFVTLCSLKLFVSLFNTAGI